MTPFVESFATRQLLPPWRAKNAQTWAFVLELKEGCVSDHLDRFFNAGFNEAAPFKYSPMPWDQQFGLLTVSYCPATMPLHALAKATEDWEGFEHLDVFLSFPVRRQAFDPGRNLLLGDETVVWVQPFVCSNSPTVVFSAREIWGCDMTYADIELVGDLSDASRIHIDAAYMGPKVFKAGEKSTKLSSLHIQTKGRRTDGVGDLLKLRPELVPFLDLLIRGGLVRHADVAGMAEIAPRADKIGFDLNSLKQLRDVYDMDRALYRAIVETTSLYDDMSGFAFLDEGGIDLAFMWSPVLQEFLKEIFGVQEEPVNGPPPTAHVGAQDGQTTRPSGPEEPAVGTRPGVHDADWSLAGVPLTPVLAFMFNSDIEFHVIETLYTYSASLHATR